MRFEPPVTPDADTAREWARDELSKSEYADQGISWFEMFLEWVTEFFDNVGDVGGALGTVGTVVLIVLAVGIVALIIWLVLGPLRRSRRNQARDGMLEGDERSSQQMRDAALVAEKAGDWDTATMEWYRASVRRMEERGRLADSPGATAHEAAELIARAVPAMASDAAQSAHSFDVARYGSGGLSKAEAAQARATYDGLAQARGGADRGGTDRENADREGSNGDGSHRGGTTEVPA